MSVILVSREKFVPPRETPKKKNLLAASMQTTGGRERLEIDVSQRLQPGETCVPNRHRRFHFQLPIFSINKRRLEYLLSARSWIPYTTTISTERATRFSLLFASRSLPPSLPLPSGWTSCRLDHKQSQEISKIVTGTHTSKGREEQASVVLICEHKCKMFAPLSPLRLSKGFFLLLCWQPKCLAS